MTTLEFQLHIDPSLYGFKFSGANYATVKYATDKVGENISVEVYGIEAGPLLFCAITDRERLIRDAEAAAKKNAVEYWSKQHSEYLIGIIKSFAPHINS
jgi:hypothetical protein